MLIFGPNWAQNTILPILFTITIFSQYNLPYVIYISLGEEAGCNLLARGRAVHVDDLCAAHIYLFEHPEAKGRYICSSHCFNIIELARSLSLKYSEYNIPTKYASPYALFNFDALTHLYLLPDELGTVIFT